MYLIDFIYDDKSLSDDFNCMIGSINSGNSSAETMLGSERELTTVKIKEESHIATSTFDDVCTASFDIIPNFCKGFNHFTDREVYAINTWLTQKKYKIFKPIYSDDSFYDLQYKAIFTTVSAIKIGDKIMGFHAELKTDRPYGYAPKRIKRHFSVNNNDYIIVNDSQDDGFLYPTKFEITCNESGNLIIANNKYSSSHYTEIKNVSSGEIIMMDGEHDMISSSVNHPNLWNDFNYNFFKLVKESSEETMNILSFEGIKDVDIILEYESIRRTGIIL